MHGSIVFIYPARIPWLAQASHSLLDFLRPSYLLWGALFLACCIAVVVTAIYVVLFRKKRRHFYTAAVTRQIESWITHILMEEDTPPSLMPDLTRVLKNSRARQHLINELITCKKNFSGSAAEQISGLYTSLGLKADSVKKIRSRRWHLKARGIQELYMMDQQDMLTTIYRNTNNRNEFVRMEAQSGVIYLTGFAGLRFLDVISYPITEWQQIKLLEQLRHTPKKSDITGSMPGWLASENDTVVAFTLKLIDEYQYFQMQSEVTNCLTHANDKVRAQAIRALIEISDDKTPMVLLGYFRKEPRINRNLILDALATIATDAEQDALAALLDDPDDIVKLKSAIVLAKCCTGGRALLEQRAARQPEPYERILKHVKSIA